MNQVFEDYDQLRAEMQRRLPQPKAGRVHIFRGQTRDFSKMLPTGLRPNVRTYPALWNLVSSQVARLMMQTKASSQELELFDWIFWFRAIAQHYGPGSNFLDVTRSLDVALWFALHQAGSKEVKTVMGTGQDLDPEHDTWTLSQFTAFEPVTNPGWLYVFEVAEWDGQGYPPHGTLLDLATAPPLFASSARIQAQHACLLVAHAEKDGGDLAKFYACEPIRVKWPLTGAPGLTARAEDLFPPPSRDEWYAKFISFPLIFKEHSDGKCYLQPPFEFTCYAPSTFPHGAEDILNRQTGLPPSLVFVSLRADQRVWQMAVTAEGTAARLRDAIPILLEGPLQYATPPLQSDSWNYGILAGDMDSKAPVYDAAGQVPLGEVGLTNVFFEFSPLEKTGLEIASDPQAEIDVVRALWVVRAGSTVCFTPFLQQFPGGGLKAIGPLYARHDPGSNRIRCESPTVPNTVFDVAELQEFGKAFVVALLVLRDLSTGLKADPYPILTSDENYLVRVTAATAYLTRMPPVQMLKGEMQTGYNVVRYIHSREPYIGPGGLPENYSGSGVVQGQGPYGVANSVEIRSRLAETGRRS